MSMQLSGTILKTETPILNSRGVYQQKVIIKLLGQNIKRTLTLFGDLIYTLKNSDPKKAFIFTCTVRIDPNDRYKRPYNNVESFRYLNDDSDTGQSLKKAS
jgi:hypothetical protein